MSSIRLNAIVAGSTGATGKKIVRELLERDEIGLVTVLTRKEISSPSEYFSSSKVSKLKIKPFSTIDSNPKESLESKYNLAFCAMGSSPYSIENDYTAPCKFADYCVKAKVSTMSLISSGGANPTSIYGYLKIIGQREEYFTSKVNCASGFNNLIILRPGLLLRGEKTRLKEKVLDFLMPAKLKISVESVARVAVDEAIKQYHQSNNTIGSAHSTIIMEQRHILDCAKRV